MRILLPLWLVLAVLSVVVDEAASEEPEFFREKISFSERFDLANPHVSAFIETVRKLQYDEGLPLYALLIRGNKVTCGRVRYADFQLKHATQEMRDSDPFLVIGSADHNSEDTITITTDHAFFADTKDGDFRMTHGLHEVQGLRFPNTSSTLYTMWTMRLDSAFKVNSTRTEHFRDEVRIGLIFSVLEEELETIILNARGVSMSCD